jgi:hypothetical protein
MKASARKQKVSARASIVAALAMGAFGITTSFNAPGQAAEAQVEESVQDLSQNPPARCIFRLVKTKTYVEASTTTCYQVQAAAKCSNNQWYIGPIAKTSRAYCPSGTVVALGIARAKATPTSPWSPWKQL